MSRFVGEGQAPRDTRIIFEQAGNCSVSNESLARIDSSSQEIGVLSHDVFVSTKRDAGIGESSEHPTVPAGENLLVACRPNSLRSHAVQLALAARNEVGMRVDIAGDVQDVDAFPVPSIGDIEKIAENAAFFFA